MRRTVYGLASLTVACFAVALTIVADRINASDAPPLLEKYVGAAYVPPIQSASIGYDLPPTPASAAR